MSDQERWFTAIRWWMDGWGIMPCQPNTKKLVRGYGPNIGVIRKSDRLAYWFRDRSANIAVISEKNGLILDFDDSVLYERFCVECPEVASNYTERTPRGGAHVFVLSEKWGEFEAVKGLEVKRFCLVNPSTVDGNEYLVQEGEFKTFDLANALRGFLTPKSVQIPYDTEKRVLVLPSVKSWGVGGAVEKVKQSWPILEYLVFFAPEVVLTGSGRWRSGRCPWHDDHNPSLWVDTVRNTWGCHACNVVGDVINWEMRRIKTDSVSKAIKSLVSYSELVRVEL